MTPAQPSLDLQSSQLANSMRIVLAVAALTLPTMIAYNTPPSATLLNQAAAIVAWASYLFAMASEPRVGLFAVPSQTRWLMLIWLIVGVAAVVAVPLSHLPGSLSRSNAGIVLAAMLAMLVAAAIQRAGQGEPAWRSLCIGFAVAAIASAIVGLVQFYLPGIPDGNWIARSSIEGRSVGNMRQPNHLSSLLLWGVIAVAHLVDKKLWPRPIAYAAALLMVWVVVLSGSRTGALGTLVLLVWGLVDRRLSKSVRILLCLMPIAYALIWLGNSAWADATHHVFGGETRFNGHGDISSSRYGIWSNTVDLIKMHPWFGVGFGEFNFAWTLTPFPGRPVAFFDHTHNLALQLLVEMGIPLGTLVIVLLLTALWFAFQAVRPQPDRDPDAPPQMSSAAFMIVLMIGLHSLLEYPLWYAYFLLPTAFAFGLCLGDPPRGRAVAVEPRVPVDSNRTRPLVVASMLMLAGGFAMIYDYWKVVVIFTADEGAPPLMQRIADGRRSWFFAHHADYALATIAEHPSEVMPAFKRAPHYLLDARLMMAWAKALDEAGETDKARYVAQRLKEFRNPQAAEFFAPCDAPHESDAKQPFQCEPPTRSFTYEDFR